jgi:hypothetical protein
MAASPGTSADVGWPWLHKREDKVARWFLSVRMPDSSRTKDALAPIWRRGADTARKALNRPGFVISRRAAMGLDAGVRVTDRASALRGTSRHTAKHLPAMDWREVPCVHGSLNARTITDPALRCLMLTATRSSEVRS